MLPFLKDVRVCCNKAFKKHFKFYFDERTHNGVTIIIIIIKNGWHCKAGGERLMPPYQSEDSRPTIQTHRMIEEKSKIVGERKQTSS